MLIGRYEPSLVVVSILVAIFASYAALNLAGRVAHAHGDAARWWMAGGALAMGTGIWSMHFIGMLAFRLPIPLGYDLAITVISLMLPIAVSALALWQVSRPAFPLRRLLTGALLMGVGINSMHYTGMAAMRMRPGIDYDPWLFAASVVIAIVASGAALWIAFRLRRNRPNVWLPRFGAAVVMGFAIVGMHYTGMAAASFPYGSVCLAASGGVEPNHLALMVIIATLAVLTVALVTSVYDARLETRSRVLALSQATAEERRQLLVRERAAREQAERMSEMRDEFLATLSHELRTPLNAILGWAQMLRIGSRDDATLVKGLATIERNARAQAQLIDDLLDMSQIISGKIRLKIEQVDPVAFIEAAIETVQPAANSKGIRIEKSFAPGVPPIPGDAARLQQVLWNLLSNAVKFTPDGGSVGISLDGAGGRVTIRVTDSGIGIGADMLPQVFDRFWQADASTTRRYGGLGLGLSIVKYLVELHGGAVAAESRGSGHGATFIVELPVVRRSVPADGGDDVRPGADTAPPGTFTPLDLSGIVVLVVDDEADARELSSRILSECGATVLTASGAEPALRIVAENRPDLFVSDIGMPEVDGFEFLKRMRALGADKGGNAPVVALTAFARHVDRDRMVQEGFAAHVAKPVEPSELVAKVAEAARHLASR